LLCVIGRPVSPVPAVDWSGDRADPAGPRRSTLSAADEDEFGTRFVSA